MCALARIITTLLDASDVIPQPPPSTVLSRHVSGCHQWVTVEAPGEMPSSLEVVQAYSTSPRTRTGNDNMGNCVVMYQEMSQC